MSRVRPEPRGESGPDRRAGADWDRKFVVFALAVLATFLLAAFLPDLVPAKARAGLAQFVHARVISVVAASPEPTDEPLGSFVPPASDRAMPSAQATPLESSSTGGGTSSSSGGTGDGTGADDGTEQGGEVVPPEATVEILEGSMAGQEAQSLVQGPSGSLELPDFRPGDDVVVEIDQQPDGTSMYTIVDRWRLPLFGTLVALLAVLAAAVAGWRGLRAIVSLALTLVLTVRLFVPLVILGWTPVPLAVAFGILITVLSFALTQGFTRPTIAAILGTSFGLLLAGILAAVVNQVSMFTPAQGSDEVVYLQQATNGSIDLSGLLLAAVIFGGLGLMNDVAISQAVTLDELHAADPQMPRLELFRRTMNVGTAHLAATVNTLVFAYLGTALPLVVLLVLQASNAGAVISLESVSVEIVRTIIGAIGIVAVVPLTTAIAARLVYRRPALRRTDGRER